MITITAGAAAFQTLKSINDVIGQIRAATDIEKVREYASGMTDRVLAAQQEAARLIQDNLALMERIDAFEKSERDRIEFDNKAEHYGKRRYHPGVFVYVKNAATADVNEIETFCPCCFENRKFRTLHTTGEIRQRYAVRFCPECKNQYSFGPG